MLGCAYATSSSIKWSIGRPRPVVEDLPHLMATPTGLSFPSSHSTSSFAAARAFTGLLPTGPLYCAATAMALSRLYLGVHYPSDVAAASGSGRCWGASADDEGRDRGDAQRGQVLAVQRAVAGRREAANYPFTTIEPNVAVVRVDDERLDEVARVVRSSTVVPDTIEFHDIAGLVAGAHKGEGLGNQFLANIRETDALLHVVRAHDDPNVIHPEGRVDPARTWTRSRPS